jgi:hypothetical protein
LLWVRKRRRHFNKERKGKESGGKWRKVEERKERKKQVFGIFLVVCCSNSLASKLGMQSIFLECYGFGNG